MSEFDVDIRAVGSASYGARGSSSDINQAASGGLDNAAVQPSTVQVSPATEAGATGAATAVGQPQFRYDSFRFLYRADYGRIVLVDQNPETGMPVSQIPSQRALQLYAEQKQAELRAAVSGSKGADGSGSAGTGSHDFEGLRPTEGATGAAHIGVGTGSAKASIPPAVFTPSPAYLGQAFPPVNITI